MADSKHTPGPWVYEDNAIMAECGVHICTPNTADDFPCVEPGTAPDAEAECEANARLIAAAPELLAALIVLRDEADGFNVSGVYFSEACMGHKGIALADAAIEKAGV